MNAILVQLEAAFDLVAMASLQASILICVIAGLRWMLRERLSPGWRSMLWLLVLIRLSMPHGPDSSLSIYNLFSEPAILTRGETGDHGGMVHLPRLGKNFLTEDETVDLAAKVGTPGEPSERGPATNPSAIIVLIWISGAAVILLYVLSRMLLLKARLRTATCVTNPQSQQLLETCKATMRIRAGIRLEETPLLGLPVLYGAFRPRLLFPEGMLAELSVSEKRHIILHELAHHRRRDILLYYWIVLIKALNWFNPLVWYALSRARQDTELACDALVLSRMDNTDSQQYGRTLIKLLEVSSGWYRLPIPTGILKNGGEVRSRLRMITNYKRRSLRSSLMIFVAALTLGVLFLTDAEQYSAHAWESNRTDTGHPNYSSAEYENGAQAVLRTSVQRQGNRVWLDGVDQPAGWGEKEANTYVSALRVVLSALGENVTYDQLMGISGAAFRIQFYRADWCPSAQSATLGFNCARPVARAFGYSLHQWITFDEPDTSVEVRDARRAVVQSIDSGYPVAAVNLQGERFEWEMDWGVITGYEDGGATFLARNKLNDPGSEHVRATTWPVLIHTLAKENEQPDWKESVLQSLKIASQVARTDSVTYYKSGFAAYKAWIEGLGDKDRFKQLDQVQLTRYMQSNAYCFYRLYTDRAVAARYIQAIQSEFDGVAAEQLSQAGEYYARIADLLFDARNSAPFPSHRKGNPWTQEMRQVQAGALREALVLETEAIHAIETAVALLDDRSVHQGEELLSTHYPGDR